MATVMIVGCGSGGIALVDALAREPGIDRFILIDPDRYEAKNVHRHLFPAADAGRLKVDLAAEWIRRFRPESVVEVHVWDITDPRHGSALQEIAERCGLGVCAVDNEPAKFAFDETMRRHRIPWTLGEVLSGGIGGWVHVFPPGSACYGCIAGQLQRTIDTDRRPPPDYAQPGGAVAETTVPASRTAVSAIASWHAAVTVDLLHGRTPEFNSMLISLTKVDGILKEAYRTHRFLFPRSPECLVCGSHAQVPSGEELDAALDQALARLAHE